METGVETLPDDAIADVLRRLPAARSLATARCVCKAWRDIIDGREILRPLLLPHSVHGIFINYSNRHRPFLFACPSSMWSASRREIDSLLGFLPDEMLYCSSVRDHCNGLLLCSVDLGYYLCVCNPATRRWTVLPPHRQATRSWSSDHEQDASVYLAFDPDVSPHYEVFLVPALPEKSSLQLRARPPRHWSQVQVEQDLASPFCLDWFFSLPEDEALVAEETEEEDLEEVSSVDDPIGGLMEWPPKLWQVNVFSSRTGRWEERAFLRDGDPAGTVKEVRLDDTSREMRWAARWRYAVFWQGSLYVHCRGGFIARLPISGHRYQLIKTPVDIAGGKPYMGRSQNRICFGVVVHRLQLRVWILSESCGKMEWVLKYQDDLARRAHQYIRSINDNAEQRGGAWMVIEEDSDMYDSDDNSETVSGEDFEGGSDNDDLLSPQVGDNEDNTTETKSELNYDEDGDDEEDSDGVGAFDILGFHPYKECVYLEDGRAAVYNFKSSKIQYLGNPLPKTDERPSPYSIHESFVYTPCMIGELGFIDQSSHLND